MRKFLLLLSVALLSLPIASETREKINVGTSTREMLVYVPANLPEYAPLVISMHGMNQDAEYQRGMANWSAVADTAKFVVVYPEGLDKSWDIGGDRDTKFIEAIINNMFERYSIDKSRVYLSGFSMGGMMTYHAASLIAGKIAAFAPISGYAMDGSARSSRSIPIIHTHGTDDDVVAYSGAEPYLQKWVAIDSCNTVPTVVKPYKGKANASMKTWRNEDTGIEVALLTLEGKGHWVSMDASSVLTSCEIWNFCKRYSLAGSREPVPPKLLTASPADKSFDLPNSGLSLSYMFNRPIICDTVRAELSGRRAERLLSPCETGISDVLTFKLADNDTVPDGEYTLRLLNVIDTCGGNNRNCKFTYYIGIENVSGEFVEQVVYEPDFISQKGLIPSGWRLRAESEESVYEKGENEDNSSGVCVVDLPSCKSMGAALGLSARNYDTASLIYGTYGHSRLHLYRGRYVITFNSIYWDKESETKSDPFRLSMADSNGNSVLDVPDLVSSGSMNKNKYLNPGALKEHRIEIYVDYEDDYTLSFSMACGYDRVLIGNIRMVTAPSYAQMYKGPFVAALARLHKAYSDLYEMGEQYSRTVLSDLRKSISEYDSFRSYTGSAYQRATSEVNEAVRQTESRTVNLAYYLDALTEAEELLRKYAEDKTISVSRQYLLLQKTMQSYDYEFPDKSSGYELWLASEDIRERIKSLLEKTDISEICEDTVTPVSVTYFGLDGRAVANPVSGVYLSRRVYGDGHVVTVKQVF